MLSIYNIFLMEFIKSPTSWSSLVYQTEAKKEAEIWMKKFEQGEQKKALCIVGLPGIGKTVFAQLFLKHYGYQYKISTASDERNSTQFINEFNTVVTNTSLLQFLQKQKIGIIVDEIEATETTDKSIISVLSSFITKMKENPIILIATHKKFFKKILKYIQIIYLQPLNLTYCMDIICTHTNNKINNNIIKNLYNEYKEGIIYRDIDAIIHNIHKKQYNQLLAKRDHIFKANEKEQCFLNLVNHYNDMENNDRINLYLYDSKYMNQVIFENAISTSTMDNIDLFLISRKLEYLTHNSQIWEFQEYIEYFDIVNIVNHKSWKTINIVPKIYSKISQYLYQNKTVEIIRQEYQTSAATPELLSSVLLNLMLKKEISIEHKMMNNLKRIGLNKDYWKKIFRNIKKNK